MLSIVMTNGKQNNEPRYAKRQIKCVDLLEDNDVCCYHTSNSLKRTEQ